jgi:hypothetical protein
MHQSRTLADLAFAQINYPRTPESVSGCAPCMSAFQHDLGQLTGAVHDPLPPEGIVILR